MEQRIRELIEEAQMVLVGIGRGFSAKCPDQEEAPRLRPYVQSRFYAEVPQEHAVIRAYDRLRELIGVKPYFVLTLNTDDLIYRSALEQDLIVAPCGSMGKMQCAEHIVEAGGIRDAVLRAYQEARARQSEEDAVRKALEHARCPVCGQPLEFHTVETEGYLERGYLPQWERYTKWLQATLNHRLCILELGADFAWPQVMRWPFEKVASYNQKAKLVRISSSFWQLPEHLADKGISIAQDPVEFLLKE